MMELRTISTHSEENEDQCVVCGEMICMRDFNEFWMVEPLNKRIWTFRICLDCQDFGRFDKWLKNRFFLEDGEE